MDNKVILVAILLVLVIVLFYTRNNTINKEGYEDVFTMEEKVQNRTNPIAIVTDPLNNPIMPIGLSVQESKDRALAISTAINPPTTSLSASGILQQGESDELLSPRIDDENSYLGLIDFCYKQGQIEGNPFTNSKFSETCGMCLTSGSVLGKGPMDKPFGVLVYPQDKEKALKIMREEGYMFPRSIPSINAGICNGASVSADSKPVLAITEKDYIRFAGRFACQSKKTFGNNCGKCESSDEWSYIDPDGGLAASRVVLWGQGNVTVTVEGKSIGEAVPLKEKEATEISLGRIKEGVEFKLTIDKGQTSSGPYCYGVYKSTNPNGKEYKVALEKIIYKDEAIRGKNSFGEPYQQIPRLSNPRYIYDVRMSLKQFIPRYGGTQMILVSTLPYTFVEQDQIASLDCPGSPYYTMEESANLLLPDDICLGKGPGRGQNSDDCLRKKIIEEGCSIKGGWYNDPTTLYTMENGKIVPEDPIDVIRNLKKEKKLDKSNPDVNVSAYESCYGETLQTPCDAYIGNTLVPDRKCMKYLYTNKGKENVRVGQTYILDTSKYSHLNEKTINFCGENGELNPDNENGYATLVDIAKNGYKGNLGMDGVKRYLTDVFNYSISDLDVNIPDIDGGKRDSFAKCFGYPIAQKTAAGVRKNKINDVVSSDKKQNARDYCMKGLLDKWDSKTIPARSPTYTTNRILNYNGNMIIRFRFNCKSKPRGSNSVILKLVPWDVKNNRAVLNEIGISIWFDTSNSGTQPQISFQKGNDTWNQRTLDGKLLDRNTGRFYIPPNVTRENSWNTVEFYSTKINSKVTSLVYNLNGNTYIKNLGEEIDGFNNKGQPSKLVPYANNIYYGNYRVVLGGEDYDRNITSSDFQIEDFCIETF